MKKTKQIPSDPYAIYRKFCSGDLNFYFDESVKLTDKNTFFFNYNPTFNF